MNAADWVIVAVMGLSMLLSLLRGFTREALSLAAWMLALFGARILAPSLATLLSGYMENPALRELTAFGILFLAILMVGLLLAHLLGEAVGRSKLSVGDRVLGTAFGFARGILIVVVVLAFARPWFADDAVWKASRLIPHLSLLENWSRDFTNTTADWISG